MLRLNTVTAGIDFSHFNQMVSSLIFDTLIKWCSDNEQIAQGNFWYTNGLCIDKRFVCIAPEKV